MARVAAYIDGFNLYYGLKAQNGRKYLWLDLQALVASLLRSNQSLVDITYFTARVVGNADSERRQSHYLDALNAHNTLVTVRTGRFHQRCRRCLSCGATWTDHEEKETDVSIAVALVEDAVRDRFDTALLISADSDLCPAVRAVKRLRPDKRVIAAFPPRRQSRVLKNTVDGFIYIPGSTIRGAQLPDEVVTVGGTAIKRPVHWS